MTAAGTSGRVRVFVASVEEHGAESLRQLEQAVLLPDERRRARRMLHPPGRDAYVLAHALQRLVLRELLGHAPAFSTGPHGKPELIGDALHVNLSHCSGYAALAVHDGAPVGVDIESRPPRADVWRVMNAALTGEECSRVLAERDPVLSFLIHWTAKEAYVKATGEGLSHSFDALSLASSAFPLLLDGAGVVEHVLRCQTFPQHVLAVCTLGAAAAPCHIEHAVCGIGGVRTRTVSIC